ncbi:MAG: DUF1829 domain-containing protein [Oscillospiraceae bacterium]|jgi:hypothetical protein|nr:DUF1829 domain-containing protein [Oscillospiraceae bacterium]
MPFLDSCNDCVEIYITHYGDILRLTDAGNTISNLELSNVKIIKSRKKILDSITNAHGIKVSEDNELFVECTPSMVSQKINSLTNCIIKVSDMLMLAMPNIKNIFSEDVRTFFDDNNIIYTENISVAGRSSYYANYEFVIPKTKKQPERFIVPINSPTQSYIKSTIFTWEDIRGNRNADSALYVLLNDTSHKIADEVKTAFTEYGISSILWSEREKHIEKLQTA